VVVLSLLGAVAAAVCFGVASVMQAVAARSAPAGAGGVDPRLLGRLLRQVPFVLGTVLDIAGFFAELAALRSLPLFVVQAAVAANLAVTAVVAVRVLHVRLSGPEWAAVAAVCVGLAMLGLSSGHENPAHVSLRFKLVMAGCVVAVGVGGALAGRLRGPARSVALGLAAGLGFGFVAIGSRVVGSLAPLDLLRDPATYVVGAGGLVAFLFFATALQGGSVTVTTGTVVVAETLVPALIGVLLLGDRTRPGFVVVAVVGFALAVAGALALARFGEPSADRPAEASRTPV
jgi:hypothetical protein